MNELFGKNPENKGEIVPILQHQCEKEGREKLGLFGIKLTSTTAQCRDCGKVVPIDSKTLRKLNKKF